MYTRDSRVDPAIDSIVCVSGEFTMSGDPTDPDIVIEMHMAYFDSSSGTSMGSCAVGHDAMSEKTLDALKVFIDSAEEDFGSMVFNRAYKADKADGESAPEVGIGSGMADLTKR